jgi:hypothetical protein
LMKALASNLPSPCSSSFISSLVSLIYDIIMFDEDPPERPEREVICDYPVLLDTRDIYESLIVISYECIFLLSSAEYFSVLNVFDVMKESYFFMLLIFLSSCLNVFIEVRLS